MNSKIFRNQCNLEATIKSTCDVLDACKEFNIKAWFAWGALLGLVRENRLLPWNNDVELMVIAEENYHRRALNLAKILERMGYHSTYYKDMSVLSIRSLDSRTFHFLIGTISTSTQYLSNLSLFRISGIYNEPGSFAFFLQNKLQIPFWIKVHLFQHYKLQKFNKTICLIVN